MKLRDAGERRAIDSIWERIGESVEYDDCAYVEEPDYFQLFTTDFVGEGTHFIPGTNPKILGEFIAAVNLSDIAAMGGVPENFLLSAFAPGSVDLEYIQEVIASLARHLKRWNVKYLGGDLKESRILGFSGFATGKVEKDRILRRKGARVGDIIAVTGSLGGPAAAYLLWKAGRMDFEEVLKITPRIQEGRKLAGLATSSMDTSDGIFSSLSQMQSVNSLGFEIILEELPLHPLAREVVEDGISDLRSILNFGGDYELVYTADKLILGREIGKVVNTPVRYPGEGYEHFGKVLDKA